MFPKEQNLEPEMLHIVTIDLVDCSHGPLELRVRSSQAAEVKEQI
jgi:hypothetical protein